MNGASSPSGREPVEPVEVIVDRQLINAAEPGLLDVTAECRASHHRAGLGRWLLDHPRFDGSIYIEVSARTLPDGSSTELPGREPTGDVAFTAGRSDAEEAAGLDTHWSERQMGMTNKHSLVHPCFN